MKEQKTLQYARASDPPMRQMGGLTMIVCVVTAVGCFFLGLVAAVVLVASVLAGSWEWAIGSVIILTAIAWGAWLLMSQVDRYTPRVSRRGRRGAESR